MGTTIWIDGMQFDDAIAYDQASQYATVQHAKSQSKILAIDRFMGEGSPIGISVQLKGANARRKIEQLQGIADRRGVVIVRSSRQKLWGNEDEILMAIKSFAIDEKGPFFYAGNLSGEFQGTPRTVLGTYRVASVQLAQDYSTEGRTIIGLPDGTTNVSHTATLREGEYAIVAHSTWDGAGFSANSSTRGKVSFVVDPVLFHRNACKVYDGTTRIMGTFFDRQGDITIENGFSRLVVDFALQQVLYYFKLSGTWTLKERFTLQAFTEFSLIFNENDYVAGQFDTGEVLELWRGKDPVFSNTTAGSFKYVVNAVPGAQQNTSGSTNYLQIAASGVHIASQRLFKITTGKSIQVQTGGGDPGTAGNLLDARYMVTASVETIANRAKEILKRQA